MQKVAIFGVPRSGTSWLGQIFNSSAHVSYRYQPIFAYSFEGSLSEKSSSKDIQQFHKQLLSTKDNFVCQKKNISGNDAPRFKKEEITHLAWKEVRYLNIIENLIEQSSTKVIGIVRHPCGVLKSWMNAPKEFDSNWDIEEEWQYAAKKNSGDHEFYGYERWLQAACMFKALEEKHPKQFRVITYEKLLSDPDAQVRLLFDFVQLSMQAQTREFLEESTTRSSDDPYGVFRKGKSGKEWKEEFPSTIINRILKDERFVALAKYFDRKERS